MQYDKCDECRNRLVAVDQPRRYTMCKGCRTTMHKAINRLIDMEEEAVLEKIRKEYAKN